MYAISVESINGRKTADSGSVAYPAVAIQVGDQVAQVWLADESRGDVVSPTVLEGDAAALKDGILVERTWSQAIVHKVTDEELAVGAAVVYVPGIPRPTTVDLRFELVKVPRVHGLAGANKARRASGDDDEKARRASGDDDEKARRASGDDDEKARRASGDDDEKARRASGDDDEKARRASGDDDEKARRASGDDEKARRASVNREKAQRASVKARHAPVKARRASANRGEKSGARVSRSR